MSLCRAAAALSLVFLLTGCVTYTHPASGPDGLASKRSEVPGASGYLAVTASFDLKTFTSYPAIEFELTNDQGEKTHLKVNATDIQAIGKGKEQVPLVFVVPAGKYSVTASMMNLPGGVVKGNRYDPSDHVLSIEKELQPFVIKANEITHLGIMKFAMTQSTSAKYLYYYSQTSVELARPPEVAWAPYQSWLKATPGTYLKKTQLGTYSWPPLFGTAPKEDVPLVLPKQQKLTDAAVIQKVTQSKRGEVGACHLHYSPQATGRVDISYVIQPDGKVKEAKLVKSTLKAPKTEGCILGVVRKLKFPKTPDDDFETWTLTWDFNPAQ